MQEQRQCRQCNSNFEVTEQDIAFYEKVSPVIDEKRYPFPPPTICPDCRLKRKVCFRNERSFYKRKCDLTGKDIISIYAPDKDVRVYGQEEWWSDKWDPRDHGRDYDFNRPFFDQIAELFKEVPLIALWNFKCENATFNNNCFSLKNSYMNYNSDEGERILYCYVTEFCNDCTDTAFLQKSELCYECVDCTNSYNCIFSQLLDNCNDCFFSTDLIGCKQCFGCHGLRQQTRCIYNKNVSEEEWNEFMENVTYTPKSITEYYGQSEKIRLTVPQISTKQVQCVNCRGNFLYQCKDADNCFDVHDGENLKNVIYAPWNIKFVQDGYAFADVELGYEIIGGGVGVHHVAFINSLVNGLSDSFYCMICGNGSEHLFGCVGMMKKDHCILNKQYTKEEYERLVPKIIEHMQSTNEWGEFFPAEISPFDYNETIAQDLFPLSKEEALSNGYRWRKDDEPVQSEKVIPAERLPEKIDDIPDDVLNWAIQCEATGKHFKIAPQELKFYRQMKLPIPHLHSEERYKRRMSRRPPRKLWKRECGKCREGIETSYSPDMPEKVYCEKCYLEAVY